MIFPIGRYVLEKTRTWPHSRCGILILMYFLVGATTPQEANVSEDIPDWREPVDRNSAPVSLGWLDIVTEG